MIYTRLLSCARYFLIQIKFIYREQLFGVQVNRSMDAQKLVWRWESEESQARIARRGQPDIASKFYDLLFTT